MKTANLDGILLDYWVARAELKEFVGRALNAGAYDEILAKIGGRPFHPSTEWMQGGPIIERERISVRHIPDLALGPIIAASIEYVPRSLGEKARTGAGWWPGETFLIAAMRAYVASKFGDEVPDDVDGRGVEDATA